MDGMLPFRAKPQGGVETIFLKKSFESKSSLRSLEQV